MRTSGISADDAVPIVSRWDGPRELRTGGRIEELQSDCKRLKQEAELTVSICDGSLDKVPSKKSGLRTVPTSIYHGTALKNTIFKPEGSV